jgi:uncharacterized protein (UPF0264 family)
MRLLVSVANREEARAALTGGADLIDAKDPSSGALGAVSLPVLYRIVSAIDGARPVTAALGDASDEDSIERAARAYAAAGLDFVKIGFAGTTNAHRAESLTAAAVRGAQAGGRDRTGVVATAYADSYCVGSLAPDAVVGIAARTGAVGVLLDTADKAGPGLRALITPAALASWVAAAHAAGLLVALAGQLTADDLPFVQEAGADIAGVRGAACDHGRTGRVVAERVRVLQAGLYDARIIKAQGPRPNAQVER